MKKLKIAFFVTGIFILGCAFNATAQNRPENTSSARATYGISAESSYHKTRKKSKGHKNKHARVSSKEKSPANRRRSNWAM